MPNPEAFINLPFGSGIQILNEITDVLSLEVP